MSEPDDGVLSTRHTCLACGGGCHGVVVRLQGEEEVQKVLRAAAHFGVTDPIVDNHLRTDERGACLFLGENKLCRIHAEWGMAAKPHVCSQYPLIVLKTERGQRLGIDPSCYTANQTWTTADHLVPDEQTVGSIKEYDADLGDEEGRILKALLSVPSLSDLFGALVPEPLGAPVPKGLSSRIVKALKDPRLLAAVQHPTAGAALQDGLVPVLQAAQGWDPANPPAWRATAAEEAWILEVARRMVYLRLASTIPAPLAVAVLALIGGVACAWHDPDPKAFGKAMAAWTRAMRRPMFWSVLMPDPPAFMRLLRG